MDNRPGDHTEATLDHQRLKYPLHKVVATIQSSDADRVTAALDAAGVFSDQIEVITPPQVPDAADPVGGSGLHGLMTRVWLGFGEDLAELEQVRRDLSDGQALVEVLVHGEQEQEHVGEILRQHGGHAMHYFGRWTITSIPD